MLSEIPTHSESLFLGGRAGNRSSERQLQTTRRRSSCCGRGSKHERFDEQQPAFSGEDFVYNASIDVRQAELAAAVRIRQALMVDAEQMQDRRM